MLLGHHNNSEDISLFTEISISLFTLLSVNEPYTKKEIVRKGSF